jgi:hypothetical protein
MDLDTIKPIKPGPALLIGLFLGSFWLIICYPILPHSRSIDFLNLYTGAFFARHWDWQHLYTASGQIAQEKIFVAGHQGLWPFVRPPAYAILMSPLALMPFGIAFGVWICSQIAMLLGCLAWAWRRFGPIAVVFGSLYFATPIGISLGQDCAFYLTILCCAYELGERKKLFLCGLVLALGLTKFHLFLLWPFVLLFARRWRMLAGFTVSGFAQGLVALAVLGWQGMLHYADFILHLKTYYAPRLNIDINAILLNTGLASQPMLIGLTAAVVALILWSSRRADPLWITFALGSAGSLLIGPHIYAYDGAMLLLPAWCILTQPGFRFAKLATILVCGPIPLIASLFGRPIEFYVALSLLLLVVALSVENRMTGSSQLALVPASCD